MANVYTQINIQFIFVVSNRDCLLRDSFRERLFQYIYGILENAEQYPLAVNGYLDHIHAFFELNPKYSISDLARIVKSNSSKWINENHFTPIKFSWQKGYAAFSYSKSQRGKVISYIKNQKEHHKNKPFREEYIDFLKSFDIKYQQEYLFDWIEIE